MANITKKLMLPVAVAAAGFLGVSGGSWLSSGAAHAAADASSTDSTITTAANTTTPPRQDQSKGGHTANGITETLLTGDTAAKAKAAAEAAVPGGTVLRVETDAEGATYEAHMTKSDGTPVTVKMDANFKATGTETGGPRGGPMQGSKSSSSST
jgi:uncharacterized membrane protein YkoI